MESGKHLRSYELIGRKPFRFAPPYPTIYKIIVERMVTHGNIVTFPFVYNLVYSTYTAINVNIEIPI